MPLRRREAGPCREDLGAWDGPRALTIAEREDRILGTEEVEEPRDTGLEVDPRDTCGPEELRRPRRACVPVGMGVHVGERGDHIAPARIELGAGEARGLLLGESGNHPTLNQDVARDLALDGRVQDPGVADVEVLPCERRWRRQDGDEGELRAHFE